MSRRRMEITSSKYRISRASRRSV